MALATDERANAYAGSFPADEIIEIPSATPSGRSIPQMAQGGSACSGAGRCKAVPAHPAAEAGGRSWASAAIPTVPPVIAASLLRRADASSTRQNGVMGRANRLLARRAAVIATGFADIKGIPADVPGKIVHTGNPVRPAVLEAAQAALSRRSSRRNASASWCSAAARARG